MQRVSRALSNSQLLISGSKIVEFPLLKPLSGLASLASGDVALFCSGAGNQ